METVVDTVERVLEPGLRYTFSFWATILGTLLATKRRTRTAGAVLLLVVGYGGVGVAWERTTKADLRLLCIPSRSAVTGVASHVPIAVVGHVLLHRR